MPRFSIKSLLVVVALAALLLVSPPHVQGDDFVRLKLLSEREFGPDVLARSANELIALGEDKAVKLLIESSGEMEPEPTTGIDKNERVGWLCRLVFEPKNDEPLRPPRFGRLSLPYESMRISDWPQFP